MHIKPIILSSIFLFTASFYANAQVEDTAEGNDDLMAMLESESAKPVREYTTATFKTTRIANGHSIENTAKGVLDFRINHRFGLLHSGVKDFFGLDGATTRIGFDYGITDWLMIGMGRSSFMKEYDGFAKVRLLRQRDGGGMPFSLSYVGAISVQTMDKPAYIPDSVEYYFSNRLAYVNQLLIARKFSNAFSLQLMPTHVHYNLVNFKNEPNDVVALGIGGRVKLSNRISLTAEWYYQIEGTKRFVEGQPNVMTKNPLTIGFDIETGGHVFQLLFSNSTAISERNLVGQTVNDWGDGDIHFGFNISRVFTVVKPKGFENSRNKIW
ncbi:MAG TPA: DUF5777 family beta-barrel protein [Flavipsychrobacter sp.]|mgnify:CR=1 FL=1|nr:DUF5777 family beta-barrel protein [Flavipsychrobacter sp.]